MSTIKSNDLQSLIVLITDAGFYPIEYRIALTAYDKGITFDIFHSYMKKVFIICDDATVLRVANYLRDIERKHLPIKGSNLYKRLLIEFPYKE